MDQDQLNKTKSITNSVEHAMEVDDDTRVVKMTATAETQVVGPVVETMPDLRPTVGYVWSAELLAHRNLFDDDKEEDEEDEDDDSQNHPEVPGRIERIYRILAQHRLIGRMKQLPIRPVLKDEVLLVHTEDLWEKVLAIQAMTEQQIIQSRRYYDSLSLYINNNTTYVAQLSCGGVIETCLAVARGEIEKGFAIVRPPGHHAEPDEHMGFCFFNNVCVAARVLQRETKIKRILILDWDVHHGNGTQSAFYDDKDVLYISLHRYDGGTFYPSGEAGSINSCGEDEGLGFNVNIPWPGKGMGDAEYLHAFQRIVMPIARSFDPELVIISAGFDAARGDQLGGCDVTPEGYAHMTHMLAALANGKLVVALEGGYSLDAIANSALAVTRVLLGEAPPRIRVMNVLPAATQTVWEVARVQKKYWDVLDVPGCEPVHEYEKITIGIPEILMAHRQDYLARHHHMMKLPLNTAIFTELLAAEAWCTSDIFSKDNNTMIVLVHEFGELRGEPISPVVLNLHKEKSYLIDFTRDLISWAIEEGYSLIDINLTERLQSKEIPSKTPDELKRGIVTYLWDNYVHLSPAKHVVFVGHGAGCAPIIQTLAKRSVSVMSKVRHVVQVAPRTTIPRAPGDPEGLRTWYRKHSSVYISDRHPFLTDKKAKPSHGTLHVIPQDKPILLLKEAMPFIKEKIKTGFESA